MKKKEKIIIGVTLICMILTVLLGLTYAYWTKTSVQSGVNVIETGCFDIDFSGRNDITLQKSFPISDEKGKELNPYTFTITNKCDSWADYQINLEALTLDSSIKEFPHNYVRSYLTENKIVRKDSTLNSSLQTTKTLDKASSAYKLYKGVLAPNVSKTYELRLWIDKDTPDVEESMNATFNSKVTVAFSFKPDKNLSTIIPYTSSEYIWKHTSNTNSITIENELNPKENATNVYDMSVEQDGSVMAYVVPSLENASLVDIYLQGDGGIKANPNLSYYFRSFYKLRSIEGLEYLDTSEVTNMSHMFEYMGQTLNDGTEVTLDVSSLSTANVKDMSYMFSVSLQRANSVYLDLRGFDTSKVTNMESMFYSAAYYAKDSISILMGDNFTAKNVININNMFYDFAKWTKGDIEIIFGNNFDAKNVVSSGYNAAQFMSGLGYYAKNINIDLGDNFNISKLDDFTNFFNYLGNQSTESVKLNLGKNFNAESATNTSSMFAYLGYGSYRLNIDKVEINLGDNFNGKNITNADSMFSYIGVNAKTVNIDLGKNFDGRLITSFGNYGFEGVGENLPNSVVIFNTGDNFLSLSLTKIVFSRVPNLVMSFTIYNKDFGTSNMFLNKALDGANANVVINYTEETESIVDTIIATKPETAKIYKGELVSS